MTGGALTAPRRMTPGDLARVASVGLRTRKLRAGLSALGITIGNADYLGIQPPPPLCIRPALVH